MNFERPSERLNRRQQALLQTSDQQTRCSLLALGFTLHAFFACLTVLVQQTRQLEFGRVFGQTINGDLKAAASPGNAAALLAIRPTTDLTS